MISHSCDVPCCCPWSAVLWGRSPPSHDSGAGLLQSCYSPHPLEPWSPAHPVVRMAERRSVENGTRARSQAWKCCTCHFAICRVPPNCQGGQDVLFSCVSRRKRKSVLISIGESQLPGVLPLNTRYSLISQTWNFAKVASAGSWASSLWVLCDSLSPHMDLWVS